jgi:hypothetical protein
MIRLYMDVHVRREVTVGLRIRGVDVLTAQEDGAARFADAELMTRATELGRVLFSQDTDFLREAAACQESGLAFSGVIFGEQLALTVGRCIRDLELIAKVYDPPDIANCIEFRPLRQQAICRNHVRSVQKWLPSNRAFSKSRCQSGSCHWCLWFEAAAPWIGYSAADDDLAKRYGFSRADGEFPHDDASAPEGPCQPVGGTRDQRREGDASLFVGSRARFVIGAIDPVKLDHIGGQFAAEHRVGIVLGDARRDDHLDPGSKFGQAVALGIDQDGCRLSTGSQYHLPHRVAGFNDGRGTSLAIGIQEVNRVLLRVGEPRELELSP